MRYLLATVTALVLLVSLVAMAQEKKKAAEKLVFKAKTGDITFQHGKHSARVKEKCETCHPGLWAEKSGGPLNYKAAMHKTAEAKKTSCATCHHDGGASFATKGNCNKCHVKAKG